MPMFVYILLGVVGYAMHTSDVPAGAIVPYIPDDMCDANGDCDDDNECTSGGACYDDLPRMVACWEED